MNEVNAVLRFFVEADKDIVDAGHTVFIVITEASVIARFVHVCY